ncbi:MAG TPA: hypothetical protein VH063_13175 [Gaiellaceae bacterium]|jgi:Zn-dependent protease|nr:hypothetical protein [Gaiellaceae bacterium]
MNVETGGTPRDETTEPRHGLWLPVNESEAALLGVVGAEAADVRVLARLPLAIAFQRRWWMTSLAVGIVLCAYAYRSGPFLALTVGLIAAAGTLVSVIAHELGHALAARRANGIEPRMIVVRSSGGVALVEGTFADARASARFSAGGPLASLLVAGAYLAIAFALPDGIFRTAVLFPAGVTLILTVANLLPIAPTDGYALFRAALWASLGSRQEAERRAVDWSRTMIGFAILASVLVYYRDDRYGLAALLLVVTLAVQHYAGPGSLARSRAAARERR